MMLTGIIDIVMEFKLVMDFWDVT